MSWHAPVLPTKRTGWFEALRKVLADELPKLWQVARLYEPEAQLVYATTVRPSGNTTKTQGVTVTNNTAFTVANPSEPREGAIVTLDFFNGSAGDIGAVTFGSEYALDGAFVAPEVNRHAVYAFVCVPD